jgi:hypothetical protein
MGTTEEEEGVVHGIDIVGRATVAETGGSSGAMPGRGLGRDQRQSERRVALLWGNRHDDCDYELGALRME